MFVLSLTLLVATLITSEAFEPDRVTKIPGFVGKTKFGTFSGYLDASPGIHFHYIFVESENDPANDPVLLWLNGGPACSSLLGFFTEQGPFRVNGTELVANPYAWNKIANMIFLESPAGTGYSYSDSGAYATNDNETSLNNLLALKSWFNKFPQYKKNDFYLTGESYAGVYIPTLSVRLLDEPSINYKGFAIGNGYLDQTLIANSLIRFSFYHGLIDSSLWSKVVSLCCEDGNESLSKCHFADSGTYSDDCDDAVSEASEFAQNAGINPYSIYEDCAKPKSPSETQIYKKYRAKSNRRKVGWSLIKKSIAVNKKADVEVNVDDTAKLTIPCVDDTLLINYLGRDDVRKALHIPDVAPEWIDCEANVSASYENQYITVKDQVVKSINAGKRGLIYNGDTDMVCDFLSGQWFSDSLGFPQIDLYQPWLVNDQVAGFVKAYQGFEFVTIKGSGHTVPEYKPAAAFEMITKFLSNTSLATQHYPMPPQFNNITTKYNKMTI